MSPETLQSRVGRAFCSRSLTKGAGGLWWNASVKVRTGADGPRWLVGGRYQEIGNFEQIANNSVPIDRLS